MGACSGVRSDRSGNDRSLDFSVHPGIAVCDRRLPFLTTYEKPVVRCDPEPWHDDLGERPPMQSILSPAAKRQPHSIRGPGGSPERNLRTSSFGGPGLLVVWDLY
jgi:hypothetical protein